MRTAPGRPDDALACMVVRGSPLAGPRGEVDGVRIVAARDHRINRVPLDAVAQSNDDAPTTVAWNAQRVRDCRAGHVRETHARSAHRVARVRARDAGGDEATR
jgi:hypothetical protein